MGTVRQHLVADGWAQQPDLTQVDLPPQQRPEPDLQLQRLQPYRRLRAEAGRIGDGQIVEAYGDARENFEAYRTELHVTANRSLDPRHDHRPQLLGRKQHLERDETHKYEGDDGAGQDDQPARRPEKTSPVARALFGFNHNLTFQTSFAAYPTPNFPAESNSYYGVIDFRSILVMRDGR